MSAWVKQMPRHVEKLGKRKANWYVEWNEPNGNRRCKSCGSGPEGKRLAKILADDIRAQIKLRTYVSDKQKRVTWDEFVAEYLKFISDRATKTISEAKTSFNHFKRILKLDNRPVASITTKDVDAFSSERRLEPGKKRGSTVSPYSVNKDLRMVKAGLRKAHEWGYIESVPKFTFDREPQKLPRYVTPDDFAKLYDACDIAEKPRGMFRYAPADWWRSLLVFAQMTGWRIGEILALKWVDVDQQTGTAITRAADNKGKRDEIVALHSIVLQHVEELRTDHPLVFPWEHDRRTLDVEFARIQDEAGINLSCDGDHEHTAACHRYGFHDLRRAFATMNAPNMTREALQSLMRHQSPLTTQRYINIAQQLNPAVVSLHVPDVLKSKAVE